MVNGGWKESINKPPANGSYHFFTCSEGIFRSKGPALQVIN